MLRSAPFSGEIEEASEDLTASLSPAPPNHGQPNLTAPFVDPNLHSRRASRRLPLHSVKNLLHHLLRAALAVVCARV